MLIVFFSENFQLQIWKSTEDMVQWAPRDSVITVCLQARIIKTAFYVSLTKKSKNVLRFLTVQQHKYVDIALKRNTGHCDLIYENNFG